MMGKVELAQMQEKQEGPLMEQAEAVSWVTWMLQELQLEQEEEPKHVV